MTHGLATTITTNSVKRTMLKPCHTLHMKGRLDTSDKLLCVLQLLGMCVTAGIQFRAGPTISVSNVQGSAHREQQQGCTAPICSLTPVLSLVVPALELPGRLPAPSDMLWLA